MASPAPSSPPDPRPSSSELNYFIASVAAVALLLLLYNAIAVGWCSHHCPIWRSRRFPRNRGDEAAHRSRVAGLIPVYMYRKEGAQEDARDDSQCAVCLSAFMEGEELRRLPKCGHSFHAACIDMWLCSHATCPLCRACVLAAPQASPLPAADAEEDPVRAHAQVLSRSTPNSALVMTLI